ncbi:MAG: hypothetical protein ACI4EQ_10705 [Lachnospiraceae bacterium]
MAVTEKAVPIGGKHEILNLFVDENTKVHSKVGNGGSFYINTTEKYIRVGSNDTTNGITVYFTFTDYIDITSYSRYTVFTNMTSWNSVESGINPGNCTLCLINEKDEIITPTNLRHYWAIDVDISNYVGKYKLAIAVSSSVSPAGYGTRYVKVVPSSVFYIV